MPALDAYDYEFVASRLHDADLLLGSVAVRIFRAPLLAVPVGGCRRGVRIEVGSATVARALRTALLGRSGFPLLRVGLSGSVYGERWLVEWGEQAPDCPVGAPEHLRFFGYCVASKPACDAHSAAASGSDLPLRQRVLDPRDELVERGCR
ncbi:DUF6302 family protein [Streptomyces sp. NPDC101151]|uniref:DUF6302 family protein n=1 Tax=Streptomyces sp. NPDC101151 TaxID=3366115 RepID=UPI00382AFFC8